MNLHVPFTIDLARDFSKVTENHTSSIVYVHGQSVFPVRTHQARPHKLMTKCPHNKLIIDPRKIVKYRFHRRDYIYGPLQLFINGLVSV